MDPLYFLSKRLDSIEAFYRISTELFREKIHEIELHEEEYEARLLDQDPGRPPFDEWEHSEECIRYLGRSAVMLLSNAMKGYLEAFMQQMEAHVNGAENKEYQAKLSKIKERSWFLRYRKLFLELYGIDWKENPVPVHRLEHLVLTRNDFEHHHDLKTPFVWQTDFHREKEPEGIFVEDENPYRLKHLRELVVDEERLRLALQDVLGFCMWLDLEKYSLLSRAEKEERA